MKPKTLIVVADSLVIIAIVFGAFFTARMIRGHLEGAERLFAYAGLFAFAFVVFPLIHKVIRLIFK
jgi:hypothetical protein